MFKITENIITELVDFRNLKLLKKMKLSKILRNENEIFWMQMVMKLEKFRNFKFLILCNQNFQFREISKFLK